MSTTTVTTTTILLPEYLENIYAEVETSFGRFLSLVREIPGGAIIINYIRASYKNYPYRSLFELALALFAIRYFLASKFSYNEKDMVKLSDKDIDELVEEWNPEPIVLPVSDKEQWQADSNPLVIGAVASRVELQVPNGEHLKNVANLASNDFLNMSQREETKDAAKKQIAFSGIGACGPPNFYGTQDAHARLEEDLARFLGAERAILYSQDFCTVPSVIACFLKRGDIVVYDSGIALATQKGIELSRCTAYHFNHNDMDNLEKVLADLKPMLDEGPLTRRFIITEGLFQNFGDSPDLRRICELKKKFKYRLFLDETLSIGVLGATGRGLPELYGIPRTDVEVTTGALSYALGSSGGFCVGENAMVHHQLISSSAYVFSAAIPPYFARVASVSLRLLQEDDSVSRLQSSINFLYSKFKECQKLKKLVIITSSDVSPILHLRLHRDLRSRLDLPVSYGGPGSAMEKIVQRGDEHGYFDENYNRESQILQQIVDRVLNNHNILITRCKRILHHEKLPLLPELMIHINVAFSESELSEAFEAVSSEIYNVLQQL